MVSGQMVMTGWWSNGCEMVSGQKNGGQGVSAQMGVEWSVVKWLTSDQGSDGARGCAQTTAVKSSRSDRCQTVPGQTGVKWSVVKSV